MLELVNKELDLSFTATELETTVKSLQCSKSPGASCAKTYGFPILTHLN